MELPNITQVIDLTKLQKLQKLHSLLNFHRNLYTNRTLYVQTERPQSWCGGLSTKTFRHSESTRTAQLSNADTIVWSTDLLNCHIKI